MEMSVALYDSDWYKLPMGLQKYFVMMIANAQIPLQYHGYGLITLNLQTFSQVMKHLLVFFI